MAINGSRAFGASGARERVDFDGGVSPGVQLADVFQSMGPRNFAVQSMSTAIFSASSQAVLNMNIAASIANTQDFVAAMAKELIRLGIFKGSYSL